jgi:hypothetical protein
MAVHRTHGAGAEYFRSGHDDAILFNRLVKAKLYGVKVAKIAVFAEYR